MEEIVEFGGIMKFLCGCDCECDKWNEMNCVLFLDNDVKEEEFDVGLFFFKNYVGDFLDRNFKVDGKRFRLFFLFCWLN